MILETEPQDSSLAISLPTVGKYAFYDPRSEPLPLQEELFPPAIAIPVDLERFTKRGKEKKKLQEILEKERQWSLASQKFNRQWVKDLTTLDGDELTDFIAFCDFSVEYINETHLVDLENQIMALLDQFKSQDEDPYDFPYTPGS